MTGIIETHPANGWRMRCAPFALYMILVPLLFWFGAATATAADAVGQQQSDARTGTDKLDESADPAPVFGLPPIVAQVFENDTLTGSVRYLKVELVFDEVDPERIVASQRVAKSLQPRLMDRVIGSLQGYRFDRSAQPKAMENIVFRSSTEVLGPYGVVIKSVTIKDLGIF